VGRLLLAATVLVATACAPGTPVADPDGTWVGTATTEGDVTTVVNESGSVWGGSALLVEEASIGVDAGEDPYMLGQVTSVWATDGEIYVVDQDIPAVRVYDRNGVYRRAIGRRGQGPGEYLSPYRVATRYDGSIFVAEQGRMKVTVYSPLGEYLDTWSWTEGVFLIRPQMVVTRDGTPYLETIERDESDPGARPSTTYGMQAAGPGGKLGAMRAFPHLEGPPNALTYLGGRMVTHLELVPLAQRTMSVTAELIYGVPTQYRYTMAAADGTQTIVERRLEPVPILDAEHDAHVRFTTARLRSRDPNWTWNGPEIPHTKPAFEAFHPGQTGRLLVSRKGPGEHVDTPDCIDDPTPQDFLDAQTDNRELVPCWRDPLIWDVFGPDGRYLGEIDIPDIILVADPFLAGETLLLVIEDEAGTIMVKRYRLVLPHEE
jgi:hypothetical protein